MFQIVVAEDNMLSRKAIVELIPWEDYGCQVCAQVDNGNDAYEIIKREKPHIALLDIKMPGLSGLDIVERAKQDNINCIFIMITAYDDFSLIQRGLKAGVFDYVLKPVIDDEFKKVLERALGQIKKEQEQKKEVEILKINNEIYSSKLKRQNKDILSKLLLDTINGYWYSAREFRKMIQEEGWLGNYFIMLLSVPKEKEIQENCYENIFMQLKKSILHCEKVFSLKVLEVLLKEEILIFINYNQKLLEEEQKLFSIRIARKMIEDISKLDKDSYISISNTSKKIEEVPILYQQSVYAGSIRFFVENQNIIHYESIRSKSISNEYVQIETIENFYKVCKEEPQKIEECVESLIEQFTTGYHLDIEYVKNILIQAAIIMTYSCNQYLENTMLLKSIPDIVKTYGKMYSIQDAANELREYARNLKQGMEGKTEVSPQAKRMLDYLNKNYAEHITLQDLSDYMGLSCAHVCRILKNDTGETFITLLNRIRVNMAIRLLKSGKWKVYEVADAVGYSNYAYFYQMFKKETGVSPKEYYKM